MNHQAVIQKLIDQHQKFSKKYYELLESWEEIHEVPDLELLKSINWKVWDHWLGNTEKEAQLNKDFLGFGMAGEGSQVALWLMEEHDFASTPVVLIGSEGELNVIAPNYETFMVFIALGYSIFGLGADNLASLEAEVPEITPFLEWLEEEAGLTTSIDVLAVLEKTRQSTPDLLKITGLS